MSEINVEAHASSIVMAQEPETVVAILNGYGDHEVRYNGDSIWEDEKDESILDEDDMIERMSELIHDLDASLREELINNYSAHNDEGEE